jgi:hypothetical protein
MPMADKVTTIRRTATACPTDGPGLAASYHQANLRFSPRAGTMRLRLTRPEGGRPEGAR